MRDVGCVNRRYVDVDVDVELISMLQEVESEDNSSFIDAQPEGAMQQLKNLPRLHQHHRARRGAPEHQTQASMTCSPEAA